MHTIKPIFVAGLITGLLAPGLVLADASDFNYVEASYQQGEVDDVDVDGFGIKASLEFFDRFLAVASYTDLGLEDSSPGFDLEGDTTTIGLGYIFGQNETASLYGTVSYIEASYGGRVGGIGFRDDDEGAQFELGARMNVGPQAEFYLAVTHTDLGSDNSDTAPSAGLVYQFLPALAGTVSYSRTSDYDRLGLGLRFNF